MVSIGSTSQSALNSAGKTVPYDEVPDDVADIFDVTVAAFESMAISNQTEQFVIDALCTVNALTLSLVAEVNGQVAGHIAFFPVTISDGADNWYGPGPVSVLPAYQRNGIGAALIEEGLSRLKDLGAKGCCLVGHPLYYRRFGFDSVVGFGLPGVPDEFFSLFRLGILLCKVMLRSMKDSKQPVLRFIETCYDDKTRKPRHFRGFLFCYSSSPV